MTTSSLRYRFDAYHVLPDSPQMQRDFLYVIASLAARSQEAFASEIVLIAKLNNVRAMEVQGFQEFLGRGFGGLVTLPDEQRPRAVLMGRREFMAESGFQIPAILEVTARKWEKESTICLVGWDAWVRGVLKFISTPDAQN